MPPMLLINSGDYFCHRKSRRDKPLPGDVPCLTRRWKAMMQIPFLRERARLAMTDGVTNSANLPREGNQNGRDQLLGLTGFLRDDSDCNP